MMDTKVFSCEGEETPPCRIKCFRSNDERKLFFICFQISSLLDGTASMVSLQRVQMLIKDLALSNNP